MTTKISRNEVIALLYFMTSKRNTIEKELRSSLIFVYYPKIKGKTICSESIEGSPNAQRMKAVKWQFAMYPP